MFQGLTEKQYMCLNDVHQDFKEREAKFKCEEVCPLECSSVDFTYEKSSAGFPSPSFLENFLDNSDIEKLLDTSEVTMELIRQSFLSLHVQFEDMVYTSITEQENLTVIDLIANIGGTLGLFIGISFLSFLEMVEILIKLFSIIIGNKFRSNLKTKNDLSDSSKV